MDNINDTNILEKYRDHLVNDYTNLNNAIAENRRENEILTLKSNSILSEINRLNHLIDEKSKIDEQPVTKPTSEESITISPTTNPLAERLANLRDKKGLVFGTVAVALVPFKDLYKVVDTKAKAI